MALMKRTEGTVLQSSLKRSLPYLVLGSPLELHAQRLSRKSETWGKLFLGLSARTASLV